MSRFEDHPTVRHLRERQASAAQAHTEPPSLGAGELRSLCLSLGADDVGLLSIDQPELAGERARLLRAFPRTRSLISFVCRMNRDNVRNPARSVANVEFHHTGEEVNGIARRIVRALEDRGIRAVNPAMGFPMEAQDYLDRPSWVVSHKPLAVAAGLGHMGIHRNVIHPRFGNFILLGTVLVEAEISAVDRPIAYNPCVECRLCVVACPVGAIGADGHFNFSACYTHNYREFLGGFTDWAKSLAESRSARDYERKVGEADSATLWQSLSFGANYKAAYCLAACPAGEEVMAPFLNDRRAFVREVVQPLQEKRETVYVVPGSNAEAHVAKRFPHKRVKRVRNSLTPISIEGFRFGLALAFQPEQARSLTATYHFQFTGAEPCRFTVVLADRACTVQDDLVGRPDLRVRADGATWIAFLRRERNLLAALLTGRIRLRGNPLLLLRFARCFPV